MKTRLVVRRQILRARGGRRARRRSWDPPGGGQALEPPRHGNQLCFLSETGQGPPPDLALSGERVPALGAQPR